MNNKNVTKVTRQASVCLSKLGRDKKKKNERDIDDAAIIRGPIRDTANNFAVGRPRR